jgi:hypothetical protein
MSVQVDQEARGHMHSGWSQHTRSVVWLVFLLGGCAASTPTLSPAEYPFHTVRPYMEIHWRLTVDSNRVQADGLIERERETKIREAWLQLLGIDATGRTVSHTAPVHVLWRSPGTLEPFIIVLTPRGSEQRYEVQVYSFEFAPQLQQRN